MDYIPYLSPSSIEIHQLAIQKARIIEDGEPCRRYDIFGFFDAVKREITICTTRINGHLNPASIINETLLHETVHLAQACKTGFKGLSAFGVKTSMMPLSASKEASLRAVIAFDRRLSHIDREAFFMESRPDLARYVLRKYCF
jgi:hypothetical protein